MSAEQLEIEVIYIDSDKSFIKKLIVSENTTIEQTIQQSGILNNFSELTLESLKTGMYGKTKPLNTVLKAGDRVEIFRTLQVDPKESRRRRAKLKVEQAKK